MLQVADRGLLRETLMPRSVFVFVSVCHVVCLLVDPNATITLVTGRVQIQTDRAIGFVLPFKLKRRGVLPW